MILRGHKTVSQKMCPHKKCQKDVKNGFKKMSQNKCTNKCLEKVRTSTPKKCCKFVCKKCAKKASVPKPGTAVAISMFSTKMIKMHLLLPRV